MFARHLVRRLLTSQQRCPLRWSEAALRDVLDAHEVYDALIHAWYESLPSDLALPSSASDEAAGVDEHCILLRDRYLSMQELLCRPLVRLALELPNNVAVPGQLLDRVRCIASWGLQICLRKTQTLPKPWRHDTWLSLRGSAACFLILEAAEAGSRTSSLLTMPHGWRERMEEKRWQLSSMGAMFRGTQTRYE